VLGLSGNAVRVGKNNYCSGVWESFEQVRNADCSNLALTVQLEAIVNFPTVVPKDLQLRIVENTSLWHPGDAGAANNLDHCVAQKEPPFCYRLPELNSEAVY
jgi:hypothetical protein